MAGTVESFPLFPLGLVLLPQEQLPLHVFEERYKVMIGECLDGGNEFGIVWLSDKGLKEIGCTARIERVLERFEDGRLNILVEGGAPFRLLRRIDALPYPAGDVELLDDDDDGDPEAAAEVRARYGDLVERVSDARPDDDALAELDAYGMAATIEFEPEDKQELLEQRSERRRLRRLEELLAAALKRLALAAEAAGRARGNGSLRS